VVMMSPASLNSSGDVARMPREYREMKFVFQESVSILGKAELQSTSSLDSTSLAQEIVSILELKLLA